MTGKNQQSVAPHQGVSITRGLNLYAMINHLIPHSPDETGDHKTVSTQAGRVPCSSSTATWLSFRRMVMSPSGTSSACLQPSLGGHEANSKIGTLNRILNDVA